MGLVDKILYPDNPKREERVRQLNSDCVHITRTNAKAFDEITARSAAMTAAASEMLAAIGRPPLPAGIKPVAVGPNTVRLELADVALDALERGGLMGAISVGAAAAAFGQGKIDAATLRKLISLPPYIGFGASGVMFDPVVATLKGLVRRQKLRDAITTLSGARASLMRDSLINREIVVYLQGATGALEALADGPYTEDQIQAVLDERTRSFVAGAAGIDLRQGNAEASKLDKGRWVKEG